MTEAKETKMDRLKANWKKLALASISLITIIYFIITGSELDLSVITNILSQ